MAVLVFTAALGAGLLSLRQQRLETMHEMARLHEAMDESRQRVWGLQVEVAERIEPAELRRALERARLILEPVAAEPPRPPRAVDAKHERR